jgi:MFS family permease
MTIPQSDQTINDLPVIEQTPPDAISEFSQDSKIVTRNFRLGVINGILYNASETLIDPTLVIVTLLSYLTQSPLLLGLVMPIHDGAWSLPQLWVSGYLQSKHHKLPLYRHLSIVRIICWASLVSIVFFIHASNLLLIAFLLAYLLINLVNGFAGLPFLEVVAKTVPPRRRGEFFALRLGLGGIGSVAASIFVKWIIDPNSPLDFPHNFGLLFFMFFVGASLSLLIYNQVNEPGDPAVIPIDTFGNQIKRSFKVLGINRKFRKFISIQSALMLAGMATPFFAIYVQQQLGGSKAMVGVYLSAYTTANLLSNAYFGRMSARIGNIKIMLVASIAGLSMSALVFILSVIALPFGISAYTASIWLIPVFILSGIRYSSMGISTNSLTLDFSPHKERSLYVGFTNTLLGIILICTSIGGIILKIFGYQVLFFFAVAMYALAFLGALQLEKTIPKP